MGFTIRWMAISARVLATVVMIVFVLAGFAIAQQETGRIVGTVRDQSNRYRFSAGAGLKLQHGWKWKIGACPDWR